MFAELKSLLCLPVVCMIAALPLGGLAQSPDAVGRQAVVADGKPMAFAVASLRKNVSGTTPCDPEHLSVTGDGFRMTNCPLIAALFMAYVPANGAAMGFSTDGRVIGAPDWMKADKYDLVARIDEADMAAWQDPIQQKEILHAMMQSLLAERCNLMAHREMRDKPVYALTTGKNGSKLHEADSLNASEIVAKHPGAGAVPGNGGMVSFGAGGTMELYGASLDTLATVLSNMAGRPVVDKTGLTGRYDIKLKMMPPSSVAAEGAADVEPSIFAVVQDQLGLKLQSAKEPLETLVIDRIERPSEN
jgi:uncharacterized protein (TIGR03435 family)